MKRFLLAAPFAAGIAFAAMAASAEPMTLKLPANIPLTLTEDGSLVLIGRRDGGRGGGWGRGGGGRRWDGGVGRRLDGGRRFDGGRWAKRRWRDGRWRHGRHWRHGRRWRYGRRWYGPGVYFYFGGYGYGSCYSRCRLYHGPRYCRIYWRNYCY